MIMKRSLPNRNIRIEFVDFPGYTGFVKSNDSIQSFLFTDTTTNHNNHVYMVRHNHILLNQNILLTYIFYRFLSNFSISVQICSISKQTAFFMRTNRHKIIIMIFIIIIRQSWGFSSFEKQFFIVFHIHRHHAAGGSRPSPTFFCHFSFFHSATASSSQRLFLGLVAWPLTQW